MKNLFTYAFIFVLVGLLSYTNSHGQLIINEVMPRVGAPNDPNQDGVSSGTQDEFIELVNSGGASLDISGWYIYTTASAPGTFRHIFPNPTIIPAGGSVVVFGGGAPNTTAVFGGAIVQTASTGGLGFLDNGTTIKIFDNQVNPPVMATVPQISYAYTANTNGISITRNPDITNPLPGDQSTPHPVVLSTGRQYSPGFKVDGSPFITNIKFPGTSANASEGAGTVSIPVSVINPDDVVATQFNLVLVGGAGTSADLDGGNTWPVSVDGGQTAKDVIINISDDINVDPNETFIFEIQAVTGGKSAARVAPLQFTLTITDNDVPTFSFNPSSATVDENDGSIQIPISIASPSGNTSVEVVFFSSSPASATSADVEGFSTHTVNFDNAGISNDQPVITITDDELPEEDEVIVFRLQNPQGGAVLGSSIDFTLTISRNDIPGVIINELCPHPAITDGGIDVNGDGKQQSGGDEFIEIVNTENVAVDISDWTITDENSTPNSLRFTFPGGTTLEPGEAVVVFGGWDPIEPASAPTRFNGSRVFFAGGGTGLGMTNGNDVIRLWDRSNALSTKVKIDEYSYIAAAPEYKSITKDPDLTGPFDVHDVLNGLEMSPGLKQDGTVFTTQVKFPSGAGTVSESAGTYDLHVTLLNPTGATANTTFEVERISGDAAELGNFTLEAKDIAATANNTIDVIIQIPITNNDAVNPDKEYAFEIKNIGGGASASIVSPMQFTLTVTDDDITKVSFDVVSATVSESEGTTYDLVVNILAPSSDHSTSVDVVLTNGSGDDIDGFTSETLTFLAGETDSKEVTITIVDDLTTEGDETFTFQLQNILQPNGNATLGANTEFSLTISANDPALVVNEIHGNPASGSPPTEGHGDANGDLIRNSTADEFIEFINTSDANLDVSGWVVRTGSAQLIRHTFPDNTIVPPHGALVLFGGQTPTGEFGGSIVQVCNATDVPNVSAAISGTNGLITNTGTTIRIQNTDGEDVVNMLSPGLGSVTASLTRIPEVTGALDITSVHPLLGDSYFSPGTKADGSSFITTIRFDADTGFVTEGTGTFDLDFHFKRTNDEVSGLEFDLILVSGDAADLGNFTTSHISLPNNAIEFTIPISITDDTSLDPSEEFVFEIQNITGGYFPTILTPQFTLTIEDNDVTTVSFTTESALVNEGDGTLALHVAISNPDANQETSAEIVLVTGTPEDLDDFETIQVIFAAGSSETQMINIPITNDNLNEQPESFVFEIQNVQGGTSATVGASHTFDLTINDNDQLIVINEFCPFPSISGQGGVDANGDGSVNGNTDEFIEIVNTSGADLDMTGWQIVAGAGTLTTRFTFPAFQLKVGEAVVVFGGWNTTTKGNSVKKIGKSRVFFATESAAPNTGLGMTNTGATIEIRNEINVLQARVDFAGSEAVNSVSRVLSPDITGTSHIAHPPLEGRTISPGVKSDGSPFIITTEVQFASASGGLYENDNTTFRIGVDISLPDPANSTTLDISLADPDADNEITFSPSSLVFEAGSAETQFISITINDDDLLEGDEVFNLEITNVNGGNLASTGVNARFGFRIYDNDMPVIFNEVHAAPATDITGDANNDGTRAATDDEFVELVNVTSEEINMSGWKLVAGTNLHHTFLPGTKLPAGKAIVVFGGGIPVGFFGGSQFQVASEESLGLTDNGQTIVLTDELDQLRSAFSYGTEGNIKQSLTRSPDITGYYLPHSDAPGSNATLFSPGSFLNGLPFGDVTTDIEPEVLWKTKVYPNPASSELTVSIPDNNITYDFILSDIHGREVTAKTKQSGNIAIDVRNLPDGMLIYRITSSSGEKMIATGKIWIRK